MVPEQSSIHLNPKTTMKPISGQTKLVGVLGNPVRHSLSPIIHNAAFEEMGLDWCYLAIPTETKKLRNIANALLAMDCKGLNITIPHKEESLNLCQKITPLAHQVRAVNTLIPNKEGKWDGANTDIEGFIFPLKEKNWENKNAIIIGCGGSARAVLAGLQKLNFDSIYIVGRNKSKLERFMNSIKDNINQPSQLKNNINIILQEDLSLIEHIKNADLIVNTTPIGMSQNTELGLTIPIGEEIWSHLKNTITLYDLIYTPRPTKWLKKGRSLDCTIVDGLEMLIQQGAASLKLWSGFEQIPIKTMKKAALKFLEN